MKSRIHANGVHFAVYAYFLEVGEPGSCSVLIGPLTPLATPSHSMDELHVFSLVFSLSHYPKIKKKSIFSFIINYMYLSIPHAHSVHRGPKRVYWNWSFSPL